MANQQLQNILAREVSRKEFLSIAALSVASVFGLGTVLKLLTGKSLTGHQSGMNYSGGDYGGKTEDK